MSEYQPSNNKQNIDQQAGEMLRNLYLMKYNQRYIARLKELVKEDANLEKVSDMEKVSDDDKILIAQTMDALSQENIQKMRELTPLLKERVKPSLTMDKGIPQDISETDRNGMLIYGWLNNKLTSILGEADLLENSNE